LQNKAKLNIQSRIEKFTPLMFCTKFGFVRTAAEMIQHGVNLDFQNVHGDTALHIAGRYGQTRMAQFLLRVGANKKLVNSEGKNPATIAMNFNYLVTAQTISAHTAPNHDVIHHLDFLLNKEIYGVDITS